jgi:hypothetical protein
MKPHPRIRKTIKWGGSVVTALLVVVWIGSGWWWCDWLNEDGTVMVGVQAGSVHVGSGNPQTIPGVGGWCAGLKDSSLDWTIDRSPSWLALPLWMPSGLCLCVVIAAWRLDTLAHRRARLNLCRKCNYDRAGLAAGAVCPECGNPGAGGPSATAPS